MLAGLAVFRVALGLTVAGLSAGSMPLYLAGTVLSGSVPFSWAAWR
jgi:hypothetical protein